MKNLKIHPPSNFYAETDVKPSLTRASLSQIGSPEALAAYLVGVEERMQRLALIVEAMRQSLAAGGLLSEAQLLEKVTELDMSDGVADGRNVAPVLQVCGKCGCSQTGQHRFCVRCGSDALRPAEGLSDP